MKKLTFAVIALLAVSFAAKAQQYVSTEPANRNVILEEFTGRGCGFCTDGHRIANQIMANNPGRAWAINIHAGSYADPSYPNMITTDGNTIHGGFSISGYPSGVVNRSTANGQGRAAWTSLANAQLNMASECNVAGCVSIDETTRVATITVEVYYTGNSAYEQNYLTVAMLQDSILGSQADNGNYNPTQWLNGQYVHMHILRDIVTESAWGDPISPTTAGTLITKTYEYQVPEVIGASNGVDVILDHIFFLAWVSERFQGTPTRPILTACELERITITDDPINPAMTNVCQTINPTCSQTKSYSFVLKNNGQNTFESVDFAAEIAGETINFQWEGSLPSGGKTTVDFDMDIPMGTFEGKLDITAVNGEPFELTATFAAECSEWVEDELEDDFTTLKVFIIQDQMGHETTWNIINSKGEVIANGGPYSTLGSSGTQPNILAVPNVPTNECYLFRIYDSAKNGICCAYGNGYYYIRDGKNNTLINGEGDFGEMASHTFSLIKKDDGVNDNTTTGLKVYPNPANSTIYVEGQDVSRVEVYNSLGQTVIAIDGSDIIAIDSKSFENGVYVVKVTDGEGAVTIKKISIAH